ncbi:MAG: helix-turn-helix domain-containing protein [Leucobacter sp.]
MAVLHATYGETRDAEAYLAHGSAIPRSDSWTEVWIEQTAQIARMILARDQGVELPASPESLAVFGEMWPFAMFAQVRHAIVGGDLDRAHQIVFEAESVHLSGTVGDGVGAAAIPVSRAQIFLARGLLGEARIAAAQAPATLLSTKLLQARISYMAGEYNRVIADAGRSVTEIAQGFSRPRIEFAGILAASYIARGEHDAAHQTMKLALQGRSELPLTLLRALPPELVDYATAHWENDADLRALRADNYADTFAQGSFYASQASTVALTRREREILEELISGRTLVQVAESLFVSKNTVKSHVSQLYRKLGVSNRNDAVLAGLKILGATTPSPQASD